MHVTEKECQTDDVVFLERDEYENLVKRASFFPGFKNDLSKNQIFHNKVISARNNGSQCILENLQRCWCS
jgi:hypothetical protein